MAKFLPSFSFWPPPRFLGESQDGLTAWIARRDAAIDRKVEQLRLSRIHEIVEVHHDRHARTIHTVS